MGILSSDSAWGADPTRCHQCLAHPVQVEQVAAGSPRARSKMPTSRLMGTCERRTLPRVWLGLSSPPLLRPAFPFCQWLPRHPARDTLTLRPSWLGTAPGSSISSVPAKVPAVPTGTDVPAWSRPCSTPPAAAKGPYLQTGPQVRPRNTT